ncbi:hypothetical protein [Caloramator fervidus]|uniref:hypothetical protein n=1 Tax=Caloramator fervidus TaxID=29344 RepID=UPI000CDF1573|nr:hypothetical protein [Caloramator fervidus]
MKISAARINKCSSLKELQERYKCLIVKRIAVNSLKFIVTYSNGCIIAVINSNVWNGGFSNKKSQRRR